MAISFVAATSVTFTSASEGDLLIPGGAGGGDLVISVFAFEGVAAGSGPWIVPNLGQFSNDYIGPPQGWQQVCWQSPSGTGVGIEVWCAILFGATRQFAAFASAQSGVAVNSAYSGVYGNSNPVLGQTVRLATTAQVTGNQPAAPTVTANAGEMVVAVGGDTMGGGGFGNPSGFTSRIDAARGGAGTAEAIIADAPITVAGATGAITFPNSASSSTAHGTTATLAIRPAPSGTAPGGVLEGSMPPDLVVGSGWTFRFAAIDPSTGANIPGVKVNGANVVAADLSAGDVPPEQLGPFMLVPGPGA
jgi:hypothetical protein